MRGVVFAGLLAVAGCGVDVTNVDLGPAAQDAATGGFAGSTGSSGGQSGNASAGGLSGTGGTSGSAGQAGSAGAAGTVSDAGADVPEDVGPDSEPDAGEDAAPDAGMEPDGSSDAAGEAEAGPCPCELQPGWACYGNASCTDWCTGLAGWSKYPSIGCWEPNYPPSQTCHAVNPPTGPKAGKYFIWYNEKFWECYSTFQRPPECAEYTYMGNGWGYWDCPFTP